MEQVMGAVRKKARVHRLLTRNEVAPAPPLEAGKSAMAEDQSREGRAAERDRDGAGAEVPSPQDGGDHGEAGDAISPMEEAGGLARTQADSTPGARGGAGDGDKVGEGAPANAGGGGGSKRKMSRFERKRMKKRAMGGGKVGLSGRDDQSRGDGEGGDDLARLEEEADEVDDVPGKGGRVKIGGGALIGKDGPGRFADKSCYIGYGTT